MIPLIHHMKKFIIVFLAVLGLAGIHGCGGAIDQAIADSIFDSNETYALTDDHTADSPITVASSITSLQHIRLTIYLQHPRIGDLKISLITPNGRALILCDHHGGASMVAQLHFADSNPQTVTHISYPLADGYYQPEESFSTLYGSDPNGIWHLKIADSIPNGEEGTLNSWLLMIEGTKE